jgi:hypothetical protein
MALVFTPLLNTGGGFVSSPLRGLSLAVRNLQAGEKCGLGLSRHLPHISQLSSSARGREPAGKRQKSVEITIFDIDFGDPFIGM